MMKSNTRRFTMLLFALLIACQFTLSRAGIPTVIWCQNNQSELFNSMPPMASNPLHELSSEEFEKILSRLGDISLVIVINELCVEDLKSNKVLPYMIRQVMPYNNSTLFYFPCVNTPVDPLTKIVKNEEQIKQINDINDYELNITLKDTNSSTCVALTGKKCRYSQTERIKREILVDNSTDFEIKTDRVLLYSSKALSFKMGKTADKAISLPGSKAEASTRTNTDGTLILHIKFSDIENIDEVAFEFFFPVKSIGYYTLKKVHYTINGAVDILETKQDIYFPYNFSYHCSLNTVFINNTAYLNITDLQIQIDAKDSTFSDAYDCVGFTSIPIWTGIFVTAILALIMIWALTMIMDIRTMDRFDDPKGKTITISATE